MTGRKAIVGLCMLCALVFSAIAAQGAAAASNGTTAFTCKKGAGVGETFKTEHCKKSDGTGEFGHFAIAENTTTEIEGSNTTTGAARENTTLKATVAGTAIELVGGITEGTGTMVNKKDAVTGEHYAEGEGTITYTEVTEKKAGCEVFTDNPITKEPGEKGVIHTEPLFATTQGQGDFLKFTPKTGTVFARFWLKNCVVEGTYTVVGSVKGVPNGATTNFNHEEVTTQGTLRLQSAAGPKAGIAGTLTLKGRANNTEAYTPLSATTVATP